MATLVEVRINGKVCGRCDAKCYNAQHDDCACVCGGANHGVGFTRAKRQVRETGQTMVENYADQLQLKDWEAMININVVNQYSLFGFD